MPSYAEMKKHLLLDASLEKEVFRHNSHAQINLYTAECYLSHSWNSREIEGVDLVGTGDPYFKSNKLWKQNKPKVAAHKNKSNSHQDPSAITTSALPGPF